MYRLYNVDNMKSFLSPERLAVFIRELCNPALEEHREKLSLHHRENNIEQLQKEIDALYETATVLHARDISQLIQSIRNTDSRQLELSPEAREQMPVLMELLDELIAQLKYDFMHKIDYEDF